MTMTLDNHDIIEALREWCARRGIQLEDDTTFTMMDMDFKRTVSKAELAIHPCVVPVKDGPYR